MDIKQYLNIYEVEKPIHPPSKEGGFLG